MKCKYIKIDGKECNASAVKGADLCFFHNSDCDSEKQRKEAQSKGGKGNAVTVKEPLPPVEIKEAKDVVTLLENTINQVRAGNIDVRTGNCIGVLSGHLIKAIEVANIANKIEIIESAIFEKKISI